MTDTRVADIYTRLKERVVGFGVRPGDRLNEVALARELDVSRTPLREALNRLMAERLVDFVPGSGFFCRSLEPQIVFDLYEMRQVIESAGVTLACERASDAEIAEWKDETCRPCASVSGMTVAEAVARDEDFHMGIALMSGNGELVAQLDMLNDRTRFIRWVNIAARVQASKAEHRAILNAVVKRDATRASTLLSRHIERRMDQVVDAVKEGFSNLYTEGAEALAARRLEDEIK
ncbi:MAG: GntR family transcriptional regulator [Pseudomonadota bacterium]